MSPTRAVVNGFAAVVREWRMWALISGLTAAFAAALVWPAARILVTNLGHSLYAGRMLGNFDPVWIREFEFKTAGAPALLYHPLLMAGIVAFLVLMTFLNGGVLAVFTGTTTFWCGCGRFLPLLLRLWPYAAVGYGIVYGIDRGLGALGNLIWGDGMEEHPLVIFGWVRAAVVLLLFLVVNMLFDYARIRAVANNLAKGWRATLSAVVFVGRNLARTSAVYALVSLLGLVLAALWWMISSALPRTALGWIVLVFVLQQIFVVARVFVRLLYFASQSQVSLFTPGIAVPSGHESGADS